MFITIVLIIFIVALAYLGYFFYKKLPDIKNLDVDSLKEEKQSRAKAKMLEAKFSRRSQEVKNKLGKAVEPQKKFLAEKIQDFKDRVSNLEEKYHKGLRPKKGKKQKEPTIKSLLYSAKRLMNNNKLSEAEKVIIEVIAKDKKNMTAYELLSDLYQQDKSYGQAEEVLKYLIKLSSEKGSGLNKLGLASLKGSKKVEAEIDFLAAADVDDVIAGYYADLSKVYEALDKPEKSLDAILTASAISPNNPKYLDKLVELAIELKDKGLARKIYNRLEKINPQNGKLISFKKSIAKM